MLHKNIRLVALIFLLLFFTYLLLSPVILRKSGAVVALIKKESKCENLGEGDLITQIGQFPIKDIKDFEDALKTIKAGDYAPMVVNNRPGGCIAISDEDLGIEVSEIPSTVLKFSLEIGGGFINQLRPEDELNETELNEIIKIMEDRIKILNWPEAEVYLSNGLINFLSLGRDVSLLTKKCQFEAKIAQEIYPRDGAASIKIGDNEYKIKFLDQNISLNGKNYSVNQSFYLEGIENRVVNFTNISALIESLILKNEDILTAFVQLGQIEQPSPRSYLFRLPIQILPSGSDRFKLVMEGMRTVFVGGQFMLEGFLIFSLDGQEIARLSIPRDFMQQEITSISVLGFGNSRAEVERMLEKTKMCLGSGVLMTGLERAGSIPYQPKYAQVPQFFLLLLLLIAAFPALLSLRYRNPKFGFITSLITLAEVFLIVGLIALTQRVSLVWTIDLPTLIGLITFASISIAQMSISIECAIKMDRKLLTLQKNINMAVFLLSFILLFTPLRTLAFALFMGMFIALTLTRPLHRDLLFK